MTTNKFTSKELKYEKWLDVPQYEGFYQVSSLGRVKSLDRVVDCRGGEQLRPGRILNTDQSHKKGYERVTLSVNKKKWRPGVHRLVLLTFLGSCPEGHEANHKDGNTANNKLDNLEYVTKSQNQLHSIRVLKNHHSLGENNPQNRLTTEQVKEIRELYSKTKRNSPELGKVYGVSSTTIRSIANRLTWAWLD